MFQLRPISRPEISQFLSAYSEKLAANGNCILRRDEYGLEAVEALPEFDRLFTHWNAIGSADNLPRLAQFDSLLEYEDGLLKHVINVTAPDPADYYYERYDSLSRRDGQDLTGKPLGSHPDKVLAESVMVDYATSAQLRRASFMEVSIGTGGVSRRFARLLLPVRDGTGKRATHLIAAVRLEECSVDRLVPPFHFPKKNKGALAGADMPTANDTRPALNPDVFDKLDDTALLEQFLTQVFPRIDPRSTATRLIQTFGSLAEVINADPHRLAEVGQLSFATIAQMKAAGEMATRIIGRELVDRPLLNNIDQLVDYCRARLARRPTEAVRVLYVDRKLNLIADEEVARGSGGFVNIEPREVIKRALIHEAGGIILVHNHPSGDPTPSSEDIEITMAIRRAANAVDMEVHDHLIVTRDDYTSLKRLGFLRKNAGGR